MTYSPYSYSNMPIPPPSTRAQIFDEALVLHSGAMQHYFLNQCNDWHIAEDLSQQLWSAVHRFFTEDQMLKKGLLYAKAKQVYIDYYRKLKCRIEIDFTDLPPDNISLPHRSEPEHEAEDDALFQQFWDIFYPDEYDEISKRIFWLHERYGYSMDEISKITGVAKSSAHDKLTRLKATCRLRLERNHEQITNHHA